MIFQEQSGTGAGNVGTEQRIDWNKEPDKLIALNHTNSLEPGIR